MKDMNIFVVGDYGSTLVEEMVRECELYGHRVRLLTFGGEVREALFDESAELYSGADLAIEVVVRDVAAKQTVITELDARLSSNTLILSATLNASATEVAHWCSTEGRIVGFTAIPPFVNATVVELMPALQSDLAMIEVAKVFWQSIGRDPVTIADSVGGVLPRIVCNLINEAAYALMEGVATPADIDLAMQLGTNHPRGPLTWADLIGIPQVVAILEALGREFGMAQYHPAPLLKQYARAGSRFYDDTTA
jgi:3-hydroxybutyryl-CoA dehydrogenase